jgi:hypothetical protein
MGTSEQEAGENKKNGLPKKGINMEICLECEMETSRVWSLVCRGY